MNVSQLQFENGKMIQASKFGKEDTSQTKLELTPEEETMIKNLKVSKRQAGKYGCCKIFLPLKKYSISSYFALEL